MIELNNIELTYESLKASGQKPRVHGNGFIQIDLPQEGYRMNIWPKQRERFETQRVDTSIHNHKFSFRSMVLCGRLIHTQYEDLTVCIHGPYSVYKIVPGELEDTKMILATPHRVDFKHSQEFWLNKGSVYEFPHSQFHKTDGSSEVLTATLMKKTEINDAVVPHVLCSFMKKPDNDYSRYQIEEEKLWPFIKQVFDELGEIRINSF